MIQISDKSNLTKNFTLKEYAYGIYYKDIKKLGEETTITDSSILHAILLQEFRNYYGKAMCVTAWQRPLQFNASVGGESNSGHLTGTATDISMVISEKTFKEYWRKWQEICKKHNVIAGMGLYDNFVHFESCITWSKKNTYWKKKNGKLIYNF